MKALLIKIIKYFFGLALILFSIIIFVPKKYDVPTQTIRENTHYWNLKAGSVIAYTLLPSKGIKKQYPIIYLHGGPGGFISNQIIKTLQPLVDDGYDIYFYDQVGSGLSNRLKNIGEYTADRHNADLKEIINTIGASKVILIGQSWGAVLATLFVANNSEKIDKIIFTSPGPIFPIQKGFVTQTSPDSLQLKQPIYTNNNGNKKANSLRTKAMAFFATTFNTKIATDNEADNFAAILNYELNKSTICDITKILPIQAGSGFYSMIMTYKSLTTITDPRLKLLKLTTPVLILKGQCDNIKWQFTKEYLDVFKNHQIKLIKNAGHFIYVEQEGDHIKAIRNFLLE